MFDNLVDIYSWLFRKEEKNVSRSKINGHRRKYGWIQSEENPNEYLWSEQSTIKRLASSIDLRNENMPDVFDQENLGSCTANALSALYSYDHYKQHSERFIPSRLFIYYNERVLEQSTNSDSGASLKDGTTVLKHYGACPEDEFPYDTSKFATKPPTNCYIDAQKHVAKKCSRVYTDVNSFKMALNNGNPVVFGFTVYESFETIQSDGMMPIPIEGESVLGGHAVLACGYDDSKECFLVRNSWGPGWGLNGYFWMPYKFINFPKENKVINSSNCGDSWIIVNVQ